jgi:hypothetical protein
VAIAAECGVTGSAPDAVITGGTVARGAVKTVKDDAIARAFCARAAFASCGDDGGS